MENADRIVRTKCPEQRGEKRPEDTGAEREVRARVRESRGQKRVPEDDGRADLDEAELEMARGAAEAGLALARKAVRVDAVSNRRCDIADENWRSDPLNNWKIGKWDLRSRTWE